MDIVYGIKNTFLFKRLIRKVLLYLQINDASTCIIVTFANILEWR
jgi:hypothetical protein